MKLLTCKACRDVMPRDRIFETGPDKRRYALKMKEFYLTPGSACANNIFTAFVVCNFVF